MTLTMRRISTELSQVDLTKAFDAIVIGSGYGGAIAAARLTEAGRKVLLLERGREVLPGQYPTDLAGVQQEVQVSTAESGPLVPGANGIMDLRINHDMHVIVGCGLGGGSLINANVALRVLPKVFNDPQWPKTYKDGTILVPFYEKAETALGITTLPKDQNPPKLQALETSAQRTGIGQFERAPIAVTFEAGPNHFGNMQVPCTMCGDCCSGCNYGAKNTTLMNYLPYAEANGATLVTQARVETVLGDDANGFAVTVTDLSVPLADQKSVTIKAPLVVLGAGTLGSFEILKKSANAGLQVSVDQLGKGFSGNGDILGFGFDANVTGYLPPAAPDDPTAPSVPLQPLEPANPIAPIYSIGAGSNLPTSPKYMPGPCITGVVKVDMTDNDEVMDGLVIEDGSPPGALAMAYPAIFFLNDAVTADFTRFPDATRRLQDIADLGTKLQNAGDIGALSYQGALAQTQSYLVMSHDQAGGVLVYKEGQDGKSGHVVVDWPGVGQEFPYPRDNDILKKYADAIWANYLPNPTWSKDFGWNLVTVHPVGGCRMADTAAQGVVNPDCQVFKGDGDSVYDGLLVCDGAVMPTSLGVNPYLTISAVAERAMHELIKRKGWEINTNPAPANSVPMLQEITPVETVSEAEKLAGLLGSLRSNLKSGIHDIEKWPWIATRSTVEDDFNSYFIDNLIVDPQVQQKLHDKCSKAFYSLWGSQLEDDLIPALKILYQIVSALDDALKPTGENDNEQVSRVLAVIKTYFGDVSPHLKFTETMSGYASPPGKVFTGGLTERHALAAAIGKADKRHLRGDFTVTADSAMNLATLDSAPVLLEGTLSFNDPANKDKFTEFTVAQGTFQLLAPDEGVVDQWRMNYRGELVGGPKPYAFYGHKTLGRTIGSNWWENLTTLPLDIVELAAPGADPATYEQGVNVLAGVINLGLQDLAKQAGTIRPYYDDPGTEGAEATIDEMLEAVKALKLAPLLTGTTFWNRLVKTLMGVKTARDPSSILIKPIEMLEAYFEAGIAAKFGNLIFQTYGGVPAYLNNFPARVDTSNAVPGDNDVPLPRHPRVKSQLFTCKDHPAQDKTLKPVAQLIRYEGGSKGPVILAPGISTIAQSFAVQTTPQSFVDALVGDGFDVWLFDYRGSPAAGKQNDFAPYNIDDIAANDWPWAIEIVRKFTQAPNVQIVGHCVGAMTAQMALLSGAISKEHVRFLIASQLTVHPVTNWFNLLKADVHMAEAVYNGLPDALAKAIGQLSGSKTLEEALKGMHVIDMVAPAPSPDDPFDTMLDMLMYNVPFPSGEPCNSPTCHRIFGIYGPSYRHANLNLETHNAIKDLFGKVSVKSFEQLGSIFSTGHVVNAQGKDTYLPKVANLDLPQHFIAGAQNTIVLPGTSMRTLDWLRRSLPDSRDKFTRKVYRHYGHMDTFIGKDAGADIFKDLVAELNKHN